MKPLLCARQNVRTWGHGSQHIGMNPAPMDLSLVGQATVVTRVLVVMTKCRCWGMCHRQIV